MIQRATIRQSNENRTPNRGFRANMGGYEGLLG
jgi:hypothetical protein